MEVFINGTKTDFSTDKYRTAGEALGQIESGCEQAGSTITSIAVDGEPLTAENLDAFFSRPLDGISQIALGTASAADITEMLRRIGSEITEMARKLEDIPLQLQKGQDEQALASIHGLSDLLSRILQLIPLTALFEQTIGKILVNETPFSAYPELLFPFLQELINGIEIKDTVLVGDLSEYELAPRLRALGAALSAV